MPCLKKYTMQIAEHLVHSGATVGDAFKNEITNLVAENSITKVLETGTLYGEGTTMAVIEGMKRHGKPFDFISIEVNPENYQQAKKNLGIVNGLHLWNGQSVAKSHLPTDTTFEGMPDHVVVDHLPQNRDRYYRREVAFNVPDKMIDKALSYFQPELVILDSAGYMGFVEFRYLMERVNHSFLLALDDTGHVKHYNTLQYIKQNPKQFTILWEIPSITESPAEGEKFGSAIIGVNKI